MTKSRTEAARNQAATIRPTLKSQLRLEILIARTFDGYGQKVEDPGEVRAALQRGLKAVADIRRPRHRLENARLQPGTDDARVRARTDGGRKPAPDVAGLARGSFRARQPADQPRVYRRYRPHLDRDGGAGRAQIVGRCLRR